jgi:cell pole-organizing protein PopZ
MSAQAPDQEPSIEEILASIRQIISDDDEGPPAASVEPERVVAPPPPPPPPPKPEPVREDVLVLKDPIAPSRPDIVMEEAEDEPLPPPVQFHDDSIFTANAQEAAVTGFARLADNIAVDKRRHTAEGVTLEDIVKDMLQPMLRIWLDDNLPPIIERLVEKELEKLARRAVDD